MALKRNKESEQYALVRSIRSGIVIDLLYSFVNEYGTTRSYARKEIQELYSHIPEFNLDIIINQMLNSALLVEKLERVEVSIWEPIKSTGQLRLSHDVLASIIRLEYERSSRSGQVARKLLENKTSLKHPVFFQFQGIATYRSRENGDAVIHSGRKNSC